MERKNNRIRKFYFKLIFRANTTNKKLIQTKKTIIYK